MESILNAFHEGGIFMYFILLFGVFSLAFIVERFIALNLRVKNPQMGFRQQLLNLAAKGDYAAAENYALRDGAGTALGRISAIGCRLRANASGEEELQARMDEALNRELSNIDKRTGFLGMFGNVSTLLGLLGTITGMIHSFAAVATASPVDRATMLSKGISEAMNCTAFGLIVAIPALVAYAIYQNKTDRIVTQLTEDTTEIYHDLIYLTEGSIGELANGKARKGVSRSSSAPELSV